MVLFVNFHEAFATHRCTEAKSNGERDTTELCP